MALTDSSIMTDVRAPGGLRQKLIAFRFATNGSGDVTAISPNYDDQLGIVRSGNNYVLTVGPFAQLCACFAKSLAAASNGTTSSGTAGTVQVNFAALAASTTVDVILVLDTGYGT